MQKCLIFLLALLSLTVQAKAEWNPYLMNHERFVHLNEEDKQTLVIRTMEMMVELESKYAKEVKVSGYSTERLQKYVRVLNEMRKFLMSEAVAATGKAGFPQLGKEFTEILAEQKGSGCIYGGWASEIVNVKGSSVCKHPSMSNNKKIREAYLNENGSCIGPDHITCNPMVFGFKKAKGEVAFCVATGLTKDKKNKAHNVSYECMRESLKVNVDPKIQDTKKDRLAYMTKAMSTEANKASFDSVHSKIFQTCACAKGDMNEDYMLYIRPHRTCFGMMNSLRTFKSKECEGLTATLSKGNLEFFNNWNAFFTNEENIKKREVPATKLPEPFDDRYNAIITDPAVQQYCKNESPVGLSCTVSVTDDPNDSKRSIATLTCPEGKEPTKVSWSLPGTTTPENPKQISVPKIDKEQPITANYSLPGDDKPKVATGTIPALADENCTVAVTDDPTDLKISIATLTCPEGKEPTKVSWSLPGTTTPENPKQISVTKIDKEQPITATYTLPGDDKAKDAKGTIPALGDENCTVAVADDPNDLKISIATLTCPEGKEPTKVSWSLPGTTTPENPKQISVTKIDKEQPITATYNLPGDDKAKDAKGTIPALGAKTDDAKPTIDTEIKETTATTLKVMANVKLGEEDITAKLDKYKISWSRKTAPKTEVKKSANNTGLEDEPEKGKDKDKDKDKLEKEIKETNEKITELQGKIDELGKNKDKNKKEIERKNADLEKLKKKLTELEVELKGSAAPVVETEVETTNSKPSEDLFLSNANPLDAPREALAYDVCASLVDDKGVAVAGPSCKSIPPIDAAKPVNNNNNNYTPGQNSQPPSFNMPVYNTRQMGIQ